MITAVTLNLHAHHHRWWGRRELIVDELLQLQPDLIALQEVSMSRGQLWWLCRHLNSALGSTVYQIVLQRRRHWWHRYWDGVGILTKLPILSHEGLSLGYSGRVALLANVELPTGHTLDFVSTHFHPVAHHAEARVEQAMGLVSWLAEPGRAEYQLLAGDFNDVPHSAVITYLKQAYRSVYELKHGREPIATFPTALVQSHNHWTGCLDYLFVNQALQVVDARLCFTQPHPADETLYPSDHVGVWAKMALRPEGVTSV